ncbi:UDP-N-acetylmuramate--L-alanine ligase [Brachybacterium sp. DNPG3]
MSSTVSPRPRHRTILAPGPVVTRADWPTDREVRSVHVIRIGGAGMSAVGRLALEAGLAVSGSDSQDGQFIAPLREAGARIGIGFSADLIAADCDLVIVSTAVRADNPEVIAAHERGIPVIHRAAGLAGLLGDRPLLAVAGTHGKTSTTGMAVMTLRGAGEDPAWALGAAVPDLGRNAGFGALAPVHEPADGDAAGPAVGTSAEGRATGVAVVEADESDGSFLAFRPTALVVTNLEADHLDFHGDAETLTAAFDAAAGRIVPGGALVVCADDAGARALGRRVAASGTAVVSYGTADDADWRVLEEIAGPASTAVRVAAPDGEIALSLSVAGHHNVLNAVGALAAASILVPDADRTRLAAGLGRFTGASRRFEVAGEVRGVTVVDDYAHHPREVEATLAAARGIVDGRGSGRVLAVFQPHLFSRTRTFAAEFARALSAADRAWVLPVYAAREDPDPQVDATTIADHDRAGTLVPLVAAQGGAGELARILAAEAAEGDLVLMLGAGDIVEMTPAVLDALGAEPEDA